jgi:hypothetical protein
MWKTVPLQEVVDDLYTHEILEYKLGEIYTVISNRVSTHSYLVITILEEYRNITYQYIHVVPRTDDAQYRTLTS